MSVYSRTNAAGRVLWRYDFQWGGTRHVSAEPHYPTKAKAEAAEKAERKRLARGGGGDGVVRSKARQRSEDMAAATPSRAEFAVTLEQACARFWSDRGRHHRSSADIKRRLEIVKRLIGPERDIASISTATVIKAMGDRRNEQTLTRTGKLSGRNVTDPSCNRDVIDQLRPVLNHAASIWEDEGLELRKINWKLARFKEADEQVCEFTDAEIQAWGDCLTAAAQRRGRDGATERAFLSLALDYGPRLGELHFPPEAFRPDAQGGAELELGRYIGKAGVVRESRKDRSLLTIPLLGETVAMLAPFADRARELGTRTIWLEEKDGRWVSISYEAMRGRLLRAAVAAGIEQGRTIHGMRHHAGTAIARTGGIALAQRLLGHKQITTTRRYAHSNLDDLRGALDQVSRKKSRPSPAQIPPSVSGPSR